MLRLGQKVWYHENRSLEGVPAVIVAKSGQLYKGVNSYSVELVGSQDIIEDVKPRDLRKRGEFC